MGHRFTSDTYNHLLTSYAIGQHRTEADDDGLSELEEEEVWCMARSQHEDADPEPNNVPMASEFMEDSAGFRVQRWKEERHPHLVGGLSLAFNESTGLYGSPRTIPQHRSPEMRKNRAPSLRVPASAPMNVPSRLRVRLAGSCEAGVDSVVVEEEGDQEWDPVPPHEYLEREYGWSRKGAATSVFEGVGRTLKGRDMSRIRDAVWNQTGFFG